MFCINLQLFIYSTPWTISIDFWQYHNKIAIFFVLSDISHYVWFLFFVLFMRIKSIGEINDIVAHLKWVFRMRDSAHNEAMDHSSKPNTVGWMFVLFCFRHWGKCPLDSDMNRSRLPFNRSWRANIYRLAFFVNLSIFLVIFVYLNGGNLTVPYEGIAMNGVHDRLRSHSRFFNSSSCSPDATQKVTSEQKERYQKIFAILTELQEQTIAWHGNDQFSGRGIVLTLDDATEILQCQVNLQMIEYTETSLPVQVNAHTNDNHSSFIA